MGEAVEAVGIADGAKAGTGGCRGAAAFVPCTGGGDRAGRGARPRGTPTVERFDARFTLDATSCVDETPFDPLLPEFPQWPAGATWPDWTRTRTSTWATSSTTT